MAVERLLRRAAAITKHDTNLLDRNTKGLYVGVAGDVRVRVIGGDVVTLKNLAAGVIHPICCDKVLSTGTTATDIVGFS